MKDINFVEELKEAGVRNSLNIKPVLCFNLAGS